MVRNTLSNWIRSSIYVSRGKKYTFSGRKWAPAMFDTYSPAGRIMKTSRQIGKSTLGSAESIARLCKYDNHNILYVSPEQDQARKYSQDKVKPMIEESPIIRRQIGRYNNVHEKEFVRGGKLYMKYAKDNADRCRGITADMVHYDEIQDQSLDLIEPVINEVLFTSNLSIKLYTGTPKSFSNPIQQKWLQSDQREWLVRCRRHSPVKWIRLGIRNIGKRGPICHHCGKLLDVDDGAWVKHNPKGELAGFHIHQMHAKISHKTQAKWNEIINKLENYERNLFLNEVLGESADSAETPITEPMLRKAAEGGVSMSEEPLPEFFSSPRYAGVDWGHGKYTTSLVIGQFWKGQFRILFMKVYEGTQCRKEYCVPDMARIINRYQCKRTHVDYGGGFGMWDDLDSSVRCPVTGMMWTNTKKARWITSYTDGSGKEAEYTIPMWSMNKIRTISTFIKEMREGKVQLPKAEEFFAERFNHNPTLPSNKNDSMRTFANHFLALRKEVEITNNGETKISMQRSGPDDTLQATVYAWAIAKEDQYSL